MAQTDRPGPEALAVRVCGVPADAAIIDALARLQLIAKRLGRQVVLVEAGEDLRALIAFMGLAEVLPVSGGPGIETARQIGSELLGHPEEGEHPLVEGEEEADPGDLAL